MPEPDKLQWRSDLGWDPYSPADPADPKDGLVIHYDSADQGLADQPHSACEAYWQRTRDFHTGPSRGWVDIGYCVDEATEILTVDGWRPFTRIEPGDTVLTLDHRTGLSAWQPLLDVYVFPAMWRTLVHLQGSGHSSLTTPEHRWPVERVNTGDERLAQGPDRGWATTATLTDTDRIPVAAPCADLPAVPKWSDALVEVIARYWAAPGGPGLTVHRGARDDTAHLRSALYAVFGPPSGQEAPWREIHGDDRTDFFLSEEARVLLEEHAPGRVLAAGFTTGLTSAQLELLLATARAANPSLAWTEREAADAYQIAAVLAGRSATVHAGPDLCTVELGDRNGVFVHEELTTTRISHHGRIWCPSTPNTTWLARREGTVHFTGNSFMACAHGYVMEGRGLFRTQAAQPGGNTSHYSVTLATGASDPITEEQINAVRQLREWLMEPASSIAGTVLGHRDFVATSCPGDTAYGMVQDGTFTEPAEWQDDD